MVVNNDDQYIDLSTKLTLDNSNQYIIGKQNYYSDFNLGSLGAYSLNWEPVVFCWNIDIFNNS